MLRDPTTTHDDDSPDASLVRRVGPQVRRSVSRYRVLERVAAGSMGVVYRAKDRHLGRDVALKVLRLDGRHQRRDESVVRARFVQEARAMARLSHPNVVPIYAIETAGGHLVIAMEYVPGQTLAEWLQVPRPWTEIVEVMLEAGEGLAAAHAAGAVHRDFKPHNVLVGDDGRVRVTDFGLALVRGEPDEDTIDEACDPPSGDPLHSLTRTGMSVGTPAYMAPEQHCGRSIDPRSDQFAFCATLYEALYGTRPFRGRDAMELSLAKRRLRLCRPPRPVRLPGWLTAVVRRGLAAQPEDRFDSMRALLDALRGSRRPRTTLAVVGGAMIGVLVGAGVATFTWTSDRASTEIADATRVEAPTIHFDLSQCRRTAAAGWLPDAQRHCATAYFRAVEHGAFGDAGTAADLLAGVHETKGSAAEAVRWRRHADAARRRDR